MVSAVTRDLRETCCLALPPERELAISAEQPFQHHATSRGIARRSFAHLGSAEHLHLHALASTSGAHGGDRRGWPGEADLVPRLDPIDAGDHLQPDCVSARRSAEEAGKQSLADDAEPLGRLGRDQCDGSSKSGAEI